MIICLPNVCIILQVCQPWFLHRDEGGWEGLGVGSDEHMQQQSR